MSLVRGAGVGPTHRLDLGVIVQARSRPRTSRAPTAPCSAPPPSSTRPPSRGRRQQPGAGVSARRFRLKCRKVVRTEHLPVGARRPQPPPLTPAQEQALRSLTDALAAHRFEQSLLQGVTGSGKTGRHVTRLLSEAITLGDRMSGRIPTPELNRFLRRPSRRASRRSGHGAAAAVVAGIG